MTSSNGTTWVAGTGGFSQKGNGVAWNGSMWVAVGEGSSSPIRTSTDGSSWTGSSVGFFTNKSNGIAWNGSLWVAVGDGGSTVRISTDGIYWSNAVGGFSQRGNGVAWNGSMWVAVGEGSSTPTTIITSKDGIVWTDVVGGFTTAGYGITWNGSLWVAVGEGGNSILISAEGQIWQGVSGQFDSVGRGVAYVHTLPYAAEMVRSKMANAQIGRWLIEDGVSDLIASASGSGTYFSLLSDINRLRLRSGYMIIRITANGFNIVYQNLVDNGIITNINTFSTSNSPYSLSFSVNVNPPPGGPGSANNSIMDISFQLGSFETGDPVSRSYAITSNETISWTTGLTPTFTCSFSSSSVFLQELQNNNYGGAIIKLFSYNS
jgi:hypothetical protein